MGARGADGGPIPTAAQPGLREALAIGDHEVVAFVGAGGKTTAMFLLSRELRAAGAKVVVTTTTKILVPQESPEVRVVLEEREADLVGAVAAVMRRGQLPVVGRATTSDGKLDGLVPDRVDELARAPDVTHVLVEADGAARKPFKAPREGEPMIPASATIVVPVVGIDAIGRPLSEVAHRPERVMALTGLSADAPLEAWAIARVVVGPHGNARGAPSTARIVPLVNKADDPRLVAAARMLAAELQRWGAERVVVAALGARRALVEVVGAEASGGQRVGR